MKRNDYVFFTVWFIVIIIALALITNDQTSISVQRVTSEHQTSRYVIEYRDQSVPYKIIDCEYLSKFGDMYTFRKDSKIIFIISDRLIDSIELYDKK